MFIKTNRAKIIIFPCYCLVASIQIARNGGTKSLVMYDMFYCALCAFLIQDYRVYCTDIQHVGYRTFSSINIEIKRGNLWKGMIQGCIVNEKDNCLTIFLFSSCFSQPSF